MNCEKCRIPFVDKSGDLEWDDSEVGRFSLEDASYQECPECGDQLLPLELARRIDKRRQELLDAWIRSRPFKEFMSASQTAKALGISRQALSKHKRIRRGFIFQAELDGHRYYLRESVEKFKEHGDGRFLISTDLTEEISDDGPYRFLSLMNGPHRLLGQPQTL